MKYMEKTSLRYNQFRKALKSTELKLGDPKYADFQVYFTVIYKGKAFDGFHIFYKPSADSYRLYIETTVSEAVQYEIAALYCRLFENNSILESNVAYIDGSFNGKSVSWAFILTKNYKFITSSSGIIEDNDLIKMHQIAGELYSAYYALKYAMESGLKSLVLAFDYQGIESWISGEWKTKNNDVARLVESIQLMISSGKMTVSFYKVKSHAGNYFNEKVDELVKKALKVSYG